jgi:nitric oxide synthase oxygenase domain/subunit
MIDIADDHYELDITRARSLLGWTPKRRLLDTLPRMIHALKTDPVAWYKTNKLEAPPDLAERAAPSKEGPACPTPPQTSG